MICIAVLACSTIVYEVRPSGMSRYVPLPFPRVGIPPCPNPDNQLV